ncbi:MAG: glycosyltransferase, partial [Solirubrobacteraceae bacterium]
MNGSPALTLTPAAGEERARPALRVAVVGMSAGPTCGARDHAVLLAEGLSRKHVSCSLHWLTRSTESMPAARAEVRAWARALAAELDRDRPDAVLLHYSVFAYAHRGLPLFVSATLSALRSSRVPVLTVLHEFVYPWRHGGWRGKVWALTQRACLIGVMRLSAAVVSTTDFRAEWLASRPWLPQRRAVVAPVFSNLPPPAAAPPAPRPDPVVGLFGYSYQGAAVALVLDAVRRVRDRGRDVRLALLGAPGHPSAAAQTWLDAARAHGVEQALSFSGTLAAQDLSNALAACEILLFVDASGPSSRKGTLAGSLASGRPVIAIDGPRRWSELIRREAAAVVPPTSRALAEAIAALLADEHARAALGARGRAFAEQRMSVA